MRRHRLCRLSQFTYFNLSSQFFSNKKDSGNIFTKIPSWTGSYQWNGRTIDSSNQPVDADSTLTLTDVYDNDATPNFSIKVINNAANIHKYTFNNAYKGALEAYVLGHGDSIAKPD